MKSVVEPLEGNRVKLSVEVDEAEFDKALDQAFRRIAREVRIPGFRPGKAPRRLIEARVGSEAARQEALRESLPGFYAQALREADLDVIASTEIEIVAGQEAGPVAFGAVVEVRPQVSVIGYGGLRVTVPSPCASEEEVDGHLERLRVQSAELAVADRPARAGDHVSIDVQGSRDGEAEAAFSADDYLYEVGSATLVPELDTHLTGSSVGDILNFEAGVVHGEPVSFRILVKKVQERVLPEVTDDWAAEVSEFETVASLRADLAGRLGVARRIQATLAVRDEAVGALVELVAEDMPGALVNDDLERRRSALERRISAQGATLAQYLQASGMTAEDLAAGLRAESVRSVKADLALRALADAEGLEATDEELDAEVAMMAERLDQTPAQLRAALERQEALATVRSDVRRAKAVGWLVEHVEIVDEQGRPIDRADLSSAREVPSGHAVPADGQEGENQS
ncbi:MAG: trigger factor [Acidimicrobiales bacterium]